MTRSRELAELGTAYDTGGLAMRNRIINGAMLIDQRYNGAAQTDSSGASIYSVDRWRVVTRSGATIVHGRYSAGGSDQRYFLGVTTSSPKTPAASDQFRVTQSIEGLNVADLWFGNAAAKTITLSFWVAHSLTGTFSGAVFNGASDRSYVFTYTQDVANAWEYKTITIPGDVAGTWAIDNGAGLQVAFDYGCGTDFQTASVNTWLAGTFLKATGSVSSVSTSGAVLRFTGVQLEAGNVATPFERRPYGTELALCQRYFYKIDADGSTLSFASGWFASTTSARVSIPTPTTLRATPTLTATLTDAIRGAAGSFTPSASNVDKLLPNSVALSFTVSGGTANRSCAFVGAGAITLSSEL